MITDLYFPRQKCMGIEKKYIKDRIRYSTLLRCHNQKDSKKKALCRKTAYPVFCNNITSTTRTLHWPFRIDARITKE